MEININLRKVTNEMDDQIAKLSAWVQTLGFVLEGLEAEGTKAKKSKAHAEAFANRYPAYSQMLFLAQSGLMECKDALEKLCEEESNLISAAD